MDARRTRFIAPVGRLKSRWRSGGTEAETAVSCEHSGQVAGRYGAGLIHISTGWDTPRPRTPTPHYRHLFERGRGRLTTNGIHSTLPLGLSNRPGPPPGMLKSVISYELNPALIEQPNDPKHDYVSREGFGIAGVLANMEDSDRESFLRLQARLQRFRPETESIEVWSSAGKVVWGLRDKGQKYPFPAVHLSWGDRQLMGLLCVLYLTAPGATIAIEEIDRGFNPARYAEVIEVLSEAAYDGLDGCGRIQIVVTTHSPSFLNRLDDRLGEIRLVTRVAHGATIVKPLLDVTRERMGTDAPDSSVGELWESGLLEDLIA